jgi:hypothetical protein
LTHFIIQWIVDDTKEILKENARRPQSPPKLSAGTENQYELSPAKEKVPTLNPGTTRVTRNSVTAYVTHLKRPKVSRFKGRRRMFNMGLISSEVKARTAPVKANVEDPFAKVRPEKQRFTR